MKAIFALLLLGLSTSVFKETSSATSSDYPAAALSDIRSLGGFLSVCGLPDSQASKFTMDRVKHDPGFDVYKVGEEKIREQALCVAYSVGLYDGWKEGHDDGVLTTHMPDGIVPFPDLQPALKSLSTKELATLGVQMHSDLPCDSDNQTAGDVRDALVKYARNISNSNPFSGTILMSRLVHPAMLSAFPCKK
jgi:hypothetical protein